MVLSSARARENQLSIDTSAAENMPGVKAVDIIHPVEPGFEVFWVGKEIVAVAAETDDQARDAIRAVKIEYDVLPFLVTDAAPENAPGYTQQLNEQTQLDPDAGFKLADAIHEGNYGSYQSSLTAASNHMGQVPNGKATISPSGHPRKASRDSHKSIRRA